MTSETIRVWRDSKEVMGAVFGPNLTEGEAEFQEMDAPYGRFQQYVAGIVAACRLHDRLGIGGAVRIVWYDADTGQPHVSDDSESPRGSEDEPDPADWWKA